MPRRRRRHHQPAVPGTAHLEEAEQQRPRRRQKTETSKRLEPERLLLVMKEPPSASPQLAGSRLDGRVPSDLKDRAPSDQIDLGSANCLAPAASSNTVMDDPDDLTDACDAVTGRVGKFYGDYGVPHSFPIVSGPNMGFLPPKSALFLLQRSISRKISP